LLTHRQTNKLWQKYNLLGGGNDCLKYAYCVVKTSNLGLTFFVFMSTILANIQNFHYLKLWMTL